ncbi:dihydroorotate dehydrogenase [Syntrophorhabdus aromaticivorans]|uniref:Dihydroorotate dehydrogenase n=1 Tax=Syntrophorhabdus aromaticivorans TaxID=328301 RepID=A0A971S0P0_9BACT|nr:dihydroorotate dehydrogenase [Syntrophorhabdus aromaticivorans]NLW35311.1 dihydroorotate dehydrogenase [Syntrophorhabdus aromaticivorans]
MENLSVKLFDRTLRNPVMNASGTLGYGREIEPLWGVETLGAYVTKGLSLNPHHGNPTPRVWEEERGLINSIGLQNVGVDRFFDQYFPLFRAKKTPVIVNFFGFTEEEYIACAERIRPDRLIVALEMNLSCPNVKQGGISFGKDPDLVHDIVKAVKGVTGIPVIAKLTPEVKNLKEIAQAAYEAGVDGFTLLNTLPAMVVDVGKRTIPIRGGLSGPVLKPVALKAVYEISTSFPVPVIGAGGIMDHNDALSFLMAGAKALQVGTATFIDPYAIPKIVKGLGEYLKRCGCPSIGAIVGTARG